MDGTQNDLEFQVIFRGSSTVLLHLADFFCCMFQPGLTSSHFCYCCCYYQYTVLLKQDSFQLGRCSNVIILKPYLNTISFT